MKVLCARKYYVPGHPKKKKCSAGHKDVEYVRIAHNRGLFGGLTTRKRSAAQTAFTFTVNAVPVASRLAMTFEQTGSL